MPLYVPLDLDGGLVYMCGGAPRWRDNFHAAVIYAEGEAVDVPTYNGLTARFENGRLIPIEPLGVGFRGLDETFTTCRNFQFAVQMSDGGRGAD